MGILGIEWIAEKVSISKLTEWEQNPRYITADEYEKLKAKLQKRGMHDVLTVDTNYTVLSGNQRLKALTELGVKEVNVIKPTRELTEEEKQAVALESNRESGKWDWDRLASEFEMPLLLDVGFSDFEINVDLRATDAEKEAEDKGEGFEKFDSQSDQESSRRSLIIFNFVNEEEKSRALELLGEDSNNIDGVKLLELLEK